MDDVSVGRLFQMTAADTANAVVPVTVPVRCTGSFMVSAEHRWRRPATVETKMHSSATYDGARPWRHWSLNCSRCQMGASEGCTVPVWYGDTFLCQSHCMLLNPVLSGASSADHRQCCAAAVAVVQAIADERVDQCLSHF